MIADSFCRLDLIIRMTPLVKIRLAPSFEKGDGMGTREYLENETAFYRNHRIFVSDNDKSQ